MIKRGLSEVFSYNRSDFEGTMLTVTEVRLSKDFKCAKVWVSIYGANERRSEVLKTLSEMSGRIRHSLAGRVRLKNVPELHFKIDESLDRAERIDVLLKNSGIEKPNSNKVID